MSKLQTADSFQNLRAGLGIGANNPNSGATYAFAYWTRNRMLLEALYRGSWIVQKAVNIVADDMTRAGIEINWPKDEEAPGRIHRSMRRNHIWSSMNTGIRWARLYGGSIGVYMIDGQDASKPLDLRKIAKGAFKGLFNIDRWMLTPSFEIVTDYGPNYGKPLYYTVASGQNVPFAGQIIHYSRVIRFEGLELPYYQRLAEYGWGMSIVEPLYDRLVAYDTATAGTSNLIHKAHLRVMKIPKLRTLIATGGPLLDAVMKQMEMIRQLQVSEGLTILDGDDDLTFNTYNFSGISDVMQSFAQQISGSTDIPQTRFFGVSPGGLGSNGDSEIRQHYDKTNQDQERQLRDPVHDVIIASAVSEGMAVPDDFDFSFIPLWQLSDTEKADIAAKQTATILSVHEASLISDQQFLRELKALTRVTGLWTSITEKDIEAADDEIPDPSELMNSEDFPNANASPGKASQGNAGNIKVNPKESEQPD